MAKDVNIHVKVEGTTVGPSEVHYHYHSDTNYNPIAGSAVDRDIGPRTDRDFK